MTYQANIFALGQRFRAEVIQTLAAQRLDFYRLPDSIDAGEIVRKSFYDGVTTQDCVNRINAAICAHRQANAPQHAQHVRTYHNRITDTALAAIMAALYPNGLYGWEEWSRYAAAGEWQ